MHFDLTDLRLFRAVAEAGSITAGAARSHLALAAASARIRGMEEQAGLRLLERGRRGTRPTAAGLTLLQHARQVLDQMARLRGELAEHAGGARGLVRLWANGAACGEILPRVLPGFLAAHPRIDIDLRERPSPAILAALMAGEADLGIAADWALPGVEGLDSAPFRGDRLVVILPRGHALARRRGLRLAELLGEDFIGLGAESALQAHLAWQAAARLGGHLRLRVSLGGSDPVCRMVAAGAGIAILPRSAALRHARSLAMVRLAEDWAVRELRLCWRQDGAPSPQAQRLREHLAAGVDG
ncbi:LysR substrate-binding domain-containing protein [Roseomonas sp. KE0001]|uniref:LysR substrate-binding domain-containing protein n=1 Tax=Roseomonas sp. KE0001 TaxID=2479201 RepID=UPI0018DFF828|nr:LysR substrate-binding domain-containing protein [Roseomonas sp. KE0001]MBI0433301.1 LysR family transcriptional regulator [Roseomonas sp. KE0001]